MTTKKIVYEKPLIITMGTSYGQMSAMSCVSGGGITTGDTCMGGDHPGASSPCIDGSYPKPGYCRNGSGA